jgi:hypothetical protein
MADLEHKVSRYAVREARDGDPYYDPEFPDEIACGLDDPSAIEFHVCVTVPGTTWSDIIYRSDKLSDAQEFFNRIVAS